MRPRVFVAATWLFLIGCDQSPRAAAEADLIAAEEFTLASASANLVGEGERVARLLGCSGCHGSNLQGTVWDEEPEFGTVAPSNLTRSAARYSDEQLERMIREGMRPDGSGLWEMPSEAFTHLSRADMKALLAYLNSVSAAGPDRPRPTFGLGAREEIKAGKLLSTPQKVALERSQEPRSGGSHHERGRYIARVVCGECHGPKLAGNEGPFDRTSPLRAHIR
jgi:mono/diheme cytochrome c family protein